MVGLRENEIKTLSALAKFIGDVSVERLVKKTGLSDSAVMRAVMVLQEKGLVSVTEKRWTLARLSSEGKAYAEQGLPERRLMTALKDLGGSATLSEVVEKAGLDKSLVPIMLGWVRTKKWADFESHARRLQIKGELVEGADEQLIALLKSSADVSLEDLSVELQDASKLLRGRKLVLVDEKTDRIVELTDAGRAAARKRVRAT